MEMESNSSKRTAAKSNGTSPTSITSSTKSMSSVPNHAPMSERQQLALIKKLEKEAAEQASSPNEPTSVSTSVSSTSNVKLNSGTINDPSEKNDRASSLISPPRHPLQVMNAVSSRYSDFASTNSSSSNRIDQLKHQEAGLNSSNRNGTFSSPLRNDSYSSSNNSCLSTPVSNNGHYFRSSSASPIGRSPALERLFKKITKKNGKGETPLHTAAIRGSRRLVRTLLTLGANPNAQDNAEWSPLHEACNRGNLGVVKLLHKYGADINLKGFGRDTPLHDAARNGQIKVVKYLVKSGASLQAKNTNNKTPREEVELVTSLKGAQTSGSGESDLDPDYYKTLSFLLEQEEKFEQIQDSSFDTSQTGKENYRQNSSNISSDESEPIDSDEEEAENEDVIKFLSGQSSGTNGNKRSPNCPNSGGSYLEVKKVFQNLGLSPTKFLDSPVKSNKNIDKLTTLKSFTCPASAKDSHRRDKGRDVPISKTRLTYGMEIDDGYSKNDLVTPSNHSISKSSKSNSRDIDSNKTNTKEIYDTTKPRQTDTTTKDNSSSNITLSGNTRIRISTNHISKPKEFSNSLAIINSKMDKSSNSGSSNQNPSAGEKRPLSSVNPSQEQHNDDIDDETKRKKQKISSSVSSATSGKDVSGKDDANVGKETSSLSGTSSTASTGGNSSSSGKGGRSTRGSSSEKTTGKASSGKVRGGGSGSLDKNDRKSPSSSGSTSATNSPKKPQSDNENEDSDNSSKTSGKSDSVSGSSTGNGLKVPPLKIVLSSSSTGGNSGSSNGANNEGNNSNQPRGGNNISPSNMSSNSSNTNAATSSTVTTVSSNQEQDPSKKGMRGSSKDDGNSGNAKNVGDIDGSDSAMTGGDGGDRTGPSSGASTPGDKEGEKLGTKRVTRSKGQGGNESGNASSDSNATGSVASSAGGQIGGDQTTRVSTNIVSGSATSMSHASSSNQVTEGGNNGRGGINVSNPSSGANSNRESPTISSSSATMNTSSTATAVSNTNVVSSAGENTQSSKVSPANTPAPGAGSSNLSSGTANTTTTNAVSSSGSATSSSYTDYRQIKRKLRSQVEESNAASIGGNGQSAQGNGNQSSYNMGSGNGNGATSSKNNGNGNAANGRASSVPSSSVATSSSVVSTSTGIISTTGSATEPMNDIEKYLNIRKQVEQRRKNLFPVQPKPPQGFKDYLMNRKTYLLQENARERLRCIQKIHPPPSLGEGPLRELFKEQEQGRYELRMKHVVEKEKLVLAVEQEILRVHGRAARALANQSLPFSVCTILRDEEIYTAIDPEQEEKNRDIRSRYNGRLFLSWLQDVDDKWEKIKEQMVLRHHNEAESLNAVQKMDWEWKVNELLSRTASGSQKSSGKHDPSHQIDDLHIPMVHVSDDFDLANC